MAHATEKVHLRFQKKKTQTHVDSQLREEIQNEINENKISIDFQVFQKTQKEKRELKKMKKRWKRKVAQRAA